MKKTVTKTKEVWSVCGCGGIVDCGICKGLGRFISETSTETIIEETIESVGDVIDVEEIRPEIEWENV